MKVKTFAGLEQVSGEVQLGQNGRKKNNLRCTRPNEAPIGDRGSAQEDETFEIHIAVFQTKKKKIKKT